MKKLLLLSLVALTALSASAYDFMISNNGHEIYFNILDRLEIGAAKIMTLEVTYKADMYYGSYSGDVTFPANFAYEGYTCAITTIGKKAFKNCTDLTSVDFGNHIITAIDDSAFYYCEKLQTINLSTFVKSYGVAAFYHCEKLPKLTLSSGTTIGESAFSYCGALKELTIPERCTLGKSAFSNCGLIDLTIADNACDSIPAECFGSNQQLRAVSLGKSITSIGNGAFQFCYRLMSIDIPDGVTSIGSWAFRECKHLESISFPESLTTIGERAFMWCTALTTLNIPNSVSFIGPSAFFGCEHLVSIHLPNSLTSIEESLFDGCSSLTTITIPESVTYMGYSFNACEALTSIYFRRKTPMAIKSTAFYCINQSECIFYVPNGSLAEYKANDLWNKYRITEYNLNASKLTYEVISEDNKTCRVFLTKGEKINDALEIPDAIDGYSVVEIGENAFISCNMTSVKIPTSVTTIGRKAFCNCQYLPFVNIRNNSCTIGESAFEGCFSLTFFSIPKDITTIEKYTFSGCTSLAAVYIPQTVTTIGEQAFYRCSLRTLTIPEGVTTIGDKAFDQSFLRSITIPTSVTTIGKEAFDNSEKYIVSLFDFSKVEPIPVKTNNNTTIVCLPEKVDQYKKQKHLQIFVAKDSESPTEDVNGDKQVNSLDVLKVYKYMQAH